jgi:Fe2+ transport system protein B
MTFNFGSIAGETPKAAPPVPGASPRALLEEPKAERQALLVGQPNVGKSVVFGALTGTYVTVSNYPGTTVEVTRGRAKFGDHVWEVIDTPGTHNLVPMSEDEAVTRDILLSTRHDAVVQVGDAKNLVRTLLLTLQIAELGIPFCLDLNMLDEARARGVSVDLEGLARELPGVTINASTATEGEGLDAVRSYLEAHGAGGAREATREATGGGLRPLACAPAFADDIEEAIAEVESHLDASLPVCRRAVATMLLAGDRGVGASLASVARVSDEAVQVAKARAQAIARGQGVPVFALLSRLRLVRAQAIVRAVQRRDKAAEARSHTGQVGWGASIAVGALAAFVAALVYDGGLARTAAVAGQADPLASFGFFDIVARLFSRGLFTGWTLPGLAMLGIATGLGAAVMRRHARVRSGAWKLVLAFGAGWTAFWATGVAERIAHGSQGTAPVHLGAAVGIAALLVAVRAGDRQDATASQAIGRIATDPVWGLPLLALVLLLAYKVVGVFGAGTAVDFVEKRIFGGVLARTAIEATATPPVGGGAVEPDDFAAEGNERLVVVAASPGAGVGGRAGLSTFRIAAQTKTRGTYVADPTARIDVYPGSLRSSRADDGALVVQATPAELRRAEARVWSGSLNRWAYGFFAWIGVPLLTAFLVGPYGLLTMGVTYAVAIVLPVVTTFFFVFSMLEDSGYLPRLAVMSNRVLRGMGLNGKAVLPMVLGLGCDTMATLTARIMETKKERMLVTLLLALGIPCSSQLSVIFALMQRASSAATFVWLAVVIGTLLGVGYVAARVLPGDKSDFLLEMPPIRQPMVQNILAKTMARIEWYLKEAVPLFLAGTALLFVLDAANLLVYVHRAGEPIVRHVLGFSDRAGVSDRVSEALLVGFLRRDFGAAGLLDLARAGQLSHADVAVSMVTITLFIPCIANVFMIAKERGWKVAGMMSGFIFPYAVAVGAVVRVGFRLFGGS